MNRLLYIHPIGLEGADMQQRSEVARSLGFDVISVPNEPYFAPEIEKELTDYATSPECAGVCVDIEADQIEDRPARNIVIAAGIAEKPLLGRQRFARDIVQNLVAIIGVPEPYDQNQGAA